MIGTTDNKITYTISSTSDDPLSIPFRFDVQSWIYVVAFAAEGGAVVNLTLGVDYTLGGSGVASTGTLTLEDSYLSGVTTGTKLVIYRIAPALQTLDLQYNTRLPAEALELALDWLAMANIDRSGILQNSLIFPLSDPTSYADSYTAPSASGRSGTLFGGSDSTTNPGLPTWLTYEEAASKLFQFADLGDLGSTVLAAISAIAPVSVFADPTSTIGNKKMGQLAIRPYGVTTMVIQGAAFMSPIECPITGEEDGFPIYSSPPWTIRHFDQPGVLLPRWYILNGGDIYYNSDDDAPLPDLASWDGSMGEAEVVTGETIPAKVWINTRENDIDPVWVEVITKNSFLDLPTSNPNVAGEFFLTSTTILNVSQG